MRIDHPLPQDMPQLRSLWQEAFGDTDAFLDAFFATGFAPERCLCMAEQGQLVAALYWFDTEFSQQKAAYLYAVATAKAHRGKGCCHKLMDKLHAILAERGYCAAILVPGNQALRAFYARMGYRDFGGIRNTCAIAQAPAARMRKISGKEYGALRKKYLPAGAVLQEGESLRFLEAYASLFAGEDFLLAAWQENSTVSSMELLGNVSQAPHILAALGAQEGSFRSPGAEPFAMWLPLKDGEKPHYFGLAFD